jgi:hypothetical protein
MRDGKCRNEEKGGENGKDKTGNGVWEVEKGGRGMEETAGEVRRRRMKRRMGDWNAKM